MTESPMAEIAATLMSSRTATVFHDHILVKEPGNSVATPWHHDQPYYLVEGTQNVSFWVPVDPVPRERTIECVATSHRWNELFKLKRFDGSDLYPGDSADSVPDIDSRRDELDICDWAVEPGDAIAFSFRTLHSSPANDSNIRRRVVSMRWVGDDARFVKRPDNTSPPFPDLDYEDGARFAATNSHNCFPNQILDRVKKQSGERLVIRYHTGRLDCRTHAGIADYQDVSVDVVPRNQNATPRQSSDRRPLLCWRAPGYQKPRRASRRAADGDNSGTGLRQNTVLEGYERIGVGCNETRTAFLNLW